MKPNRAKASRRVLFPNRHVQPLSGYLGFWPRSDAADSICSFPLIVAHSPSRQIPFYAVRDYAGVTMSAIHAVVSTKTLFLTLTALITCCAFQPTAHYGGTNVAAADKKAVISNRGKLEELGCFTPEGLEKLRRGNSPAITKGEHKGDTIAMDHVLPRSVIPELTARFYNLEAIPSLLNLAKSAKIEARELAAAQVWRKQGLLSEAGFATVEAACK